MSGRPESARHCASQPVSVPRGRVTASARAQIYRDRLLAAAKSSAESAGRPRQGTWARPDFSVIGNTLQIVCESLAEVADVRAGQRVLDIAGGNGNASLAAARRYARVTCTDCAPQVLDKGAERARAEGLEILFEVADAQKLPFADGDFDVVLSTFGAMFAPEHRRVSQELLRVVRSGGRIGLASWTPDGFFGELFAVLGHFAAPPAGNPSPMLWGSELYIAKLFGPRAEDLRCVRRHFNFRYRSAAHWIDVFRSAFGPTNRAFGLLDDSGQSRLRAALTELLERWNIAGPTSSIVPGEYLEMVITKA